MQATNVLNGVHPFDCKVIAVSEAIASKGEKRTVTDANGYERQANYMNVTLTHNAPTGNKANKRFAAKKPFTVRVWERTDNELLNAISYCEFFADALKVGEELYAGEFTREVPEYAFQNNEGEEVETTKLTFTAIFSTDDIIECQREAFAVFKRELRSKLKRGAFTDEDAAQEFIDSLTFDKFIQG